MWGRDEPIPLVQMREALEWFGIGFKRGWKFKRDDYVQCRGNNAFFRATVLSLLDNGAAVRVASILVMARCRFVVATGQNCEVRGGFKEKAMRTDGQPDDCQQEGQHCFQGTHEQFVCAELMPDPADLFNVF